MSGRRIPAPRELWRGFWRGDLRVTAFWTLGLMVVTVAVTMFLPRQYRAVVRVAPAPSIEETDSGGLAQTLGGLGVGSLFGSDARFAVDLESTRSYEVVSRLQSDSLMMHELFPGRPAGEQLDPSPSTWEVLHEFRKRAAMTFDARYGIAEASFRAAQPARAADLLTKWLREADGMLRDRKLAEISGRIAQLEAELHRSHQVDVQEALEKHLVSELRQQALVKAARGVAFTLVETPVPPDMPVFPRPKLMALVIGLLYCAMRFVVRVLLGRAGPTQAGS